MKSKKQGAAARLRIEALEAKQMMAGDVVVGVVNGSLEIRGDDQDNQIAVTAGPTPGSFLVRGLDGTTVRERGADPSGEADAPESGVLVEGVWRGVRAGMAGGDDTVVLSDAALRGSVLIQTGAGDDRVLVGVGRDGRAPDGEAPSDEATAETADRAVAIGGSLRVATGGGDDTVVVGAGRIGGSLLVDTGRGEDTVRLGAPTPGGESDDASVAVAPDRAGLRVAGNAWVRLGEGGDTLAANGVSTGGRFAADGQQGADTMRLSQTSARMLALSGGRGDSADEVAVTGSRANVAAIHTGAGDDLVRVVDSAFGLLAVELGAGDDRLAADGVRARAALLAGGPGGNDFFREGENRIGRQIVVGFESPNATPVA
ncbi:hypothetical protein [Botrimarina sp.]|uniref:hypothetical protein n=1 Tax=Botrimarina sp. TaxID=2795802 RepID=UPI0032EDA3FC